MTILAAAALLFWWTAWFYPFLFRAPHFQKRPSVTVPGPTRAGLLLECLAIFLAFWFHGSEVEPWRVAAAAVFGLLAPVLSWTSVAHLGRQFRVHAGLYEDHELVRTGPYAIVRHPIYTSLLCMLLATILTLTLWPWPLVSLALFLVGTEIRIRSEEKLLASRFGEAFAGYRRRVPAYIPLIR
jgi:protein-S-isoprenylcysteine O-methyltransferase Ste14